MNLPVTACIANARARPWGPHKYPDKAAQDASLDMLTDWIVQYPYRTDTCTRASHEVLHDACPGAKRMITVNSEL